MIITSHPDNQNKHYSDFYIGYWKRPKPKFASIKEEAKYNAMNSFMQSENDRYEKLNLPDPNDFIDPLWDPTERMIVAMYTKIVPEVEHWRGYSFCRLGCDGKDVNMGTTCKGDGVYTWPAGFSHYIDTHSVKPPQQFIDHVLANCHKYGI